MNLFSYTGGFSIYAGVGGATNVKSVDISKGAIEAANKNWALNGLKPEDHEGDAADVYEYFNTDKNKWDIIIVDPPSMTHSEDNKPKALQKYTDIFAAACKKVSNGGDLVLSSCSSHISFNDFFEIINESLSKSRRTGQTIKVSGQGVDHPYPHICPELRYLKFVHLKLN